MSPNNSDIRMPAGFSGAVRLFPLPDLVLYPSVIQALHVFEPRYRALTRESLATDQLIAICKYKQVGTTTVSESSQRIEPVCCISRIVAHRELEDGRFNLLVSGITRAFIDRELDSAAPYRTAEVSLIEDIESMTPAVETQLRTELAEVCQSLKLIPEPAGSVDWKNSAAGAMPLGQLVDLISFSARLDCSQRQTILELPDIQLRCRRLIEMIREPAATEGVRSAFPPEFSSN